MQQKFIHLRVHTEYSISDGLVRIKPLLQACVDNNMPAVAITDHCNFFGLVKFYRAAMAMGVKPIAGVDVEIGDTLCRDAINQGAINRAPTKLTLLCQNQTGYRNVIRLISRAYVEGQERGRPIIKEEWLKENAEGIIVLAKQLVADLLEYFPDRFYLELQRTGRVNEENYVKDALRLAHEYLNVFGE